jgi:hypothetical protein
MLPNGAECPKSRVRLPRPKDRGKEVDADHDTPTKADARGKTPYSSTCPFKLDRTRLNRDLLPSADRR